jgi:hypothetical protein
MSRVSTTGTMASSAAQRVAIPHERIALRAYEKWVKRGRPAGTDVQDWIEAEAELRAEVAATATAAAPAAAAGGKPAAKPGSTGWTSPTGQRF